MMNLLEDQPTKRQQYLDVILASASPRKLIVAGPGTGKTYTFGKLFRKSAPGTNLVLTFIRKLVADMDREFGGVAEVKTFHAYCKKLLHERYGGIELVSFLTQVIKEDAASVGRTFSDFSDAFQTLEEDSPEVAYYLERGDYYKAVSFDDSVFRVYQAVKNGALDLPAYTQIVIDEFQDFNPLEVAFIDELQQNSPILIVGDDDQAVYSLRNSSPDYLREKWQSGEYTVFELPYCSRCPRVVVEATSAFIDSIVQGSGFVSRTPRPFVPYLKGKEYENNVYPQVISATTSTIACLSRLILMGIQHIPEIDIREAHDKGYPCVLIVGQRQYLNPLHKSLKQRYPNIAFTQAEPIGYSTIDGYELLLKREESNLGWRVLAGCDLPAGVLTQMLRFTHDGTQFRSLLPEKFISKHSSILQILKSQQLGEAEKNLMHELLGDQSLPLTDHFFPADKPEQPGQDLSGPSILLSSFEGCKGLSAGHVFIVGLNQGIVPRIDPGGAINDIECCKFIVAMTRTRKLLYLLANRWDYGPGGPRFAPSVFLQMIPSELRRDGGYLKIGDLEAFFSNA